MTLPWPFAELLRREPRFGVTALVLAALMSPTLAAFVIDRRTFYGENLWLKPLKFEIALFVYLATLAWFAAWLPKGVSDAGAYRIFSWAVVTAVALEMIWVGGAAAVGIKSHFNTAQPFMATIYGFMGLLAVLLTSASLVYGILILGDNDVALEPVFHLSVGIGLILTFVLTVIVAGALAARPDWRAGAAPDLRLAHFFASHALHFIPLFGFAASQALAGRAGMIAVATFSIAYAGFVGFLFLTASAGKVLAS